MPAARCLSENTRPKNPSIAKKGPSSSKPTHTAGSIDQQLIDNSFSEIFFPRNRHDPYSTIARFNRFKRPKLSQSANKT